MNRYPPTASFKTATIEPIALLSKEEI